MMETYRIDQISRKTEYSPKTGKNYEKVGLKINGEWYNGFGRQGVTDTWKPGMEVTDIKLETKTVGDHEYKNWSLLNKNSALEERVATLEKQMKEVMANMSTPF